MRDRVVTIPQDLSDFSKVLQQMEAKNAAVEQVGVTTQELAKELGWPMPRVLKLLHELDDLGRLRVGNAYRHTLAGHLQRRSVYFLAPNEEGNHAHVYEPAPNDRSS